MIYCFSSRSVPGLYGWRSRILVPCRLVVTRNYSVWITEGLGKNDGFCCYLTHWLTEVPKFAVPLSTPFMTKFEWTRLQFSSGMLSWVLSSWKHSQESFTPLSITSWKFAWNGHRLSVCTKEKPNVLLTSQQCWIGNNGIFFQIEVELLQALLYLWSSWLLP